MPWFCSHAQSQSDFPMDSYEYPSIYSQSNVKCPKGWIPYHTSCYKFFNEQRTFEEANNYCDDQKPSGALVGNLLTVWDEYEQQFARTFLRDDSLATRSPVDLPNGFWVGLQYSQELVHILRLDFIPLRSKKQGDRSYQNGSIVTRVSRAPPHDILPAFPNLNGSSSLEL